MPGPHRASQAGAADAAPDEPQARIEALKRALSRAYEPDDRLAIAGRLGLAWLELYEHTGDPSALAAGLARLHTTIDSGAGHPDEAWWAFWLGLGYAERGRRRGSFRDYQHSVRWISARYTRAKPGCPVRARAARALVDVCWEQLLLARVKEPGYRTSAITEVDRLIARMAPLLRTVAEPGDLAWSRMVVGLACLYRNELGGDRADLDRGLDLLATASIFQVARDTPLLARVGSELTNAWRRRGLLDEDITCLDQAIDVGCRILEDGLGDGPEWQLLHLSLAYTYEARWQATDCPQDLDGAVEAWSRVIGGDDLTPVEILAALDRPEDAVPRWGRPRPKPDHPL